MLRIVFSFGLLLAVTAQSSKDAKILKEQRFNAGDGRFGSAFAQEDGTVYREETTADGERIGQYSYVDSDGQTITVKYSAGKDGFRILEGSHVPEGATGLSSAPFNPDIAANSIQEEPTQPASPPQRKAVRRRLPIQQRPVSRQSPLSQNNPPPKLRQPLPITPSQSQGTNVNPFINPADPTHLNLQFNTNAADFAGNKQPGQTQELSRPRQTASFPSAASVPDCADCGGVNPFVNPADSSHQQLFRQHNLASVQSGRQSFQPAQQSFQPAQQSFQSSQKTFKNPKQSLQPTQQSFQPAQQSFQSPRQNFQQTQQTFQQHIQPAQQSFQSPQQSFQPAQQSFQSPQQSFQPAQQSFQSPQQSFQPAQQSFQSPQQSFQPAQQSFQSPQQPFQTSQKAFQPTQQTFQSPQQSHQEAILPAFIEQPSKHTSQFSPQQQFQQPQQFQSNSPQNDDFQGQLSLNRFQSGFNFDFSA